ncbi:MAG TPA: FxDxF family PEP-CTERM protein [Rhizomicrobium sp.]
MRATFLAAIAFAALASFSSAQAVTNVPDGNFDTPPGGNPFTTYNNTTFGPWHVNGSVDLIGNYWQAPPTGGGSVDLAGNYPGNIFQIFPVAAGSFKLSFYLAGNPDGGDPIKTLRAFVTNSAFDLTSYDFTFDTTGFSKSNMGWTLEQFSFTNPTAGNIQLQFVGTNDNTAYGAVIGGINISAVPEPDTWAMLLLGFGGIGLLMRRRGALARTA